MADLLRPSFLKPPVVETVLGVQFEAISGLTNAHLGAFWKTLAADWPRVADAQPIPWVFEKFGDEVAWELMGAKLRLRSDAAARLQIKTASEDRMIQVQNGRLMYNWLRCGTAYPRYRNSVKPGFDAALSQFRIFLENEGLSPFKPNQWEVTYVNHLPRERLWASPDDWRELIGGLMPERRLNDMVALESVAADWHFEIKPQLGRLHIEVQHGRAEGPEGPEVLILKLTTRGPVKGDDLLSGVDHGLQLGHDVIVDTFKRLTSGAAHDFWEEVR